MPDQSCTSTQSDQFLSFLQPLATNRAPIEDTNQTAQADLSLQLSQDQVLNWLENENYYILVQASLPESGLDHRHGLQMSARGRDRSC